MFEFDLCIPKLCRDYFQRRLLSFVPFEHNFLVGRQKSVAQQSMRALRPVTSRAVILSGRLLIIFYLLRWVC